MLFNSSIFFLFFIATYALFWAFRNWTAKKVVILLASYIFYASWNPPFVLLLIATTVIDFCGAQVIYRTRHRGVAVSFLVLSIVFNLGVLFFFKYWNFVIDNVNWVSAICGRPADLGHWYLILPLGISFYVFESMSYTIDVYRGNYVPSRSFLDYAFFITFFPHLIAGPIVRANCFLPQCETDSAGKIDWSMFSWGAMLFAYGLFRKMVIADNIAPVADRVFLDPTQCGFSDCWIATYAFAVQIFCDFSGYSLMAIGLAMTLGFNIPDNFHAPYGATGFSDFWRRWHISLSSWLRDYLYIPLGGNRKGPIRTYANLLATMLLGGIWHGASWNFVIWGGLHGSYLAGERLLTGSSSKPRRNNWISRSVSLLRVILVFQLVCITWVFFRARSLANSWLMVKRMLLLDRFRWNSPLISRHEILAVVAIVFLMIAWHLWRRHRTLEQIGQKLPDWARSSLAACFIVAAVLLGGRSLEFIYFQF